MASNLKMKNVMVNSDDDEDEKVSGKKTEYLDLPLEKLNLGPKKKLLVLNLGGLLVDRVHRRNESAVRRFTPDLAHGNFLGPKGEMQEFLDGLVDANDVPTYVKGHPFGQPAITDSHSDWNYYVKIIRAAENPGFGVYEFDSDYSD
ncbi:hypothetical protein CQW23_21416 [Capsicum baccatum]|uniref:Uncharacterized protein n=1 Tax=Capsicum baccatum TaxID=33114 RepID=A0A2G2VY25_CAPBA|nr:hypothetical protein CQW23_21416 [Capsicum baccatum]